MDETDTATVELTKGEAREVINALSAYRHSASGRDDDLALNIRELLQREFGFEDRHFENDQGLVESFAEVFDTSDSHEVQFSQTEAKEVVSALSESRADADPAEAETIENIREEFERTFDLDGRTTT